MNPNDIDPEKMARITAAMKAVADKAAHIERDCDERLTEILDATKERSNANVSAAIALSVDLMRAQLDALTVIYKLSDNRTMNELLFNRMAKAHSRVSAALLGHACNSGDETERETKTLLAALDVQLGGFAKLRDLAEEAATTINRIIEEN